MAEELTYGVNAIIYGDSKVGKTSVAATTPAPRLILDAENGSRFLRAKKIKWDPQTEQPPVDDGTWDTCIVQVREYKAVDMAYQWLNSGKHPFRSVVIDSISETQQRAVDVIAGKNQMQTQDWGILLRNISELIRSFRDLTMHPTNPMDAVIFIAMMKLVDVGEYRPFMQGQIATTFPYYVDGCFYLGYAALEDGTMVRRLYTSQILGHRTVGERLGGCLGPYVDNANLTEMLQTIRLFASGGEITG